MQSPPLSHFKVSLEAEMVLGWFTEGIITVLLGIIGPKELWHIELVNRAPQRSQVFHINLVTWPEPSVKLNVLLSIGLKVNIS